MSSETRFDCALFTLTHYGSIWRLGEKTRAESRLLAAQFGEDDFEGGRHLPCELRLPGDAWDTAYAALYLASDEAKYVPGSNSTSMAG